MYSVLLYGMGRAYITRRVEDSMSRNITEMVLPMKRRRGGLDEDDSTTSGKTRTT